MENKKDRHSGRSKAETRNPDKGRDWIPHQVRNDKKEGCHFEGATQLRNLNLEAES